MLLKHYLDLGVSKAELSMAVRGDPFGRFTSGSRRANWTRICRPVREGIRRVPGGVTSSTPTRGSSAFPEALGEAGCSMRSARRVSSSASVFPASAAITSYSGSRRLRATLRRRRVGDREAADRARRAHL